MIIAMTLLLMVAIVVVAGIVSLVAIGVAMTLDLMPPQKRKKIKR